MERKAAQQKKNLPEALKQGLPAQTLTKLEFAEQAATINDCKKYFGIS